MSRAARARPAPSATKPASRMCREPAGQPVPSVTRPVFRTCKAPAAAWAPLAMRPVFRTCKAPVAAWAPLAMRPEFRTCRAPAAARVPSATRPEFRTCRAPAAARAPSATRQEFRTCKARAARKGQRAPKPATRRRPLAAAVAQLELEPRLEHSPTPAAVRLLAPRVCSERCWRWSASRSCGPRRFCGDSSDSDRCELETAGRKPGGFLLSGVPRQTNPLWLSGYVYRMLTELAEEASLTSKRNLDKNVQMFHNR